MINRDRPLVPPRGYAIGGEFTQVGDQFLTPSEVALAQPAAPAATSTNHAERVRAVFAHGGQADSLKFSGNQSTDVGTRPKGG